MIDYVNTKLKVADIKFENDYKCFVMEPVPNLHKERHTLYDDKGNKYQPVGTSYWLDDDDLTVYTFEFKEQDIDIPIGTELMFEPEKWRRELPDCEIKSIRYVQNTYSFPDSRILRGFDLLIKKEGEISITTPRTSFQRYDRTVKFTANEDKIKQLFTDLSTCVSGNNCYCDQWMDDTARSMNIRFENSEEYEYFNVFYNFEEKTNVKFIFDFLKCYEDKNEFIYSTSEPEKIWYQISLKATKRNNVETNRIKFIKQAKRLKIRCIELKDKGENTFIAFSDRYEREELLSVLDFWDYDFDELENDTSLSNFS